MTPSTTAAAPPDREPVSRRALSSFRAYRFRVPYFVPQWTPRTFLAMVRCAATGRIVEGTGTARLARRLQARLAVPAALPTANGRTAIELALRAMGVGAGDEVVLPSFCCTSTLPPIRAIGAIPVLADIGPELNVTPATVEAALTSRTRAVIVPHLFGNPADIQGILARCAARGVAVIDDAAQAMGATLGARMLGTFGDVGLVSFGNGKVCFGTGGGALISGRPEIAQRAAAVDLARPAARATLSHALSVMIWRRWRRWLLPLQPVLRRLRGPREPALDYAPGGMANLDAEVALTLLDRLDGDLSARRARVDAYVAALASEPRVSLIPHRPGSACLTQVICVDPDRPEGGSDVKVIGALREAGYEIERSYTPLHLRPEFAHLDRGALAESDRVWRSLVELPCEPSVALADVTRIGTIIRRTLERSRA